MDLKSKVVFCLSTDDLLFENYTVNGHYVARRHDIAHVKNLAEFRDFIAKLTNVAKFGVNKGTYKIDIKRNVIISDEDDRATFNSMTFPDKQMSIILSTTDKLLYVQDINPLLQQKFPEFHMVEPKIINPQPIYLESFDGQNVKYRPLTQNGVTNDIVFDTNLNPLWPVGADPLIQLLSKTTEQVR